ncbi:hypothetical protein, partial [Thermus scotoductus]|uniref:hypothetical protein n=1 Tax=Thermus scotoductus TaxID=37636 RepID=UPI001C12A484
APTPQMGRGIRRASVRQAPSRLASCCEPMTGAAILCFGPGGRGVTCPGADCPNLRPVLRGRGADGVVGA